MAPIGLVVTLAMLALGGDAKHHDKLRFDRWPTADCKGHVIEKYEDVQLGKCRNHVDARSIRFRMGKKHNSGWKKKVDQGKVHCFATYYTEPNCPEVHSTNVPPFDSTRVRIPDSIAQCQQFEAEDDIIRSVKFTCGKDEPDYTARIATVTSAFTSWSIDAAGTPHAFPSGVVVNNTIVVPAPTTPTPPLAGPDGRRTTTVWLTQPVPSTTILSSTVPGTTTTETALSMASQRPLKHAEREIDSHAEAKKRDSAPMGVWLRNPWSGADSCWSCVLENGIEFECHTGPYTNIYCPPLEPTTSTIFAASTQTVAFFDPNWTEVDHTDLNMLTTATAAAFKERANHLTVKLQHPFVPHLGSVCAKAKWHHHNSDKGDFELNGPEDCGDEPTPIDIARPTYLATAKATFTETQTFPGMTTTTTQTHISKVVPFTSTITSSMVVSTTSTITGESTEPFTSIMTSTSSSII
ncbi:hypothetical protein BCR34DRAFT_609269, partial [Clohesyomyces aquaticus]